MDLDKFRIELSTILKSIETSISYLCDQLLIQQREIQSLKEKGDKK